MIFQIQLARPQRQCILSLCFLFQMSEERQRRAYLRLRAAGNSLRNALLIFQHVPGSSPAPVSKSVTDQRTVVQPLLTVTFPGSLDLGGIQIPVIGGKVFRPFFLLNGRRVVIFGTDKMGQDPCAVYSLPQESIIRHPVGFIPADFCGHKVTDSTFFHNLGKRGGITEHIRQPQDLIIHAELLPEESFPIQELANQRLSGRQITVGLHKHAAFRFPSSLLYPALYLFIHFRSVLLHIQIQLRLTGHENEFRILTHQLQCGGKASDRLICRHIQRPQPRYVNVCMPHRINDFSGLSAFFLIKFPLKILLRSFQTFIKGERVFLSQIQQIQRLRNTVRNLQSLCLLRLQKLSHLIRNP